MRPRYRRAEMLRQRTRERADHYAGRRRRLRAAAGALACLIVLTGCSFTWEDEGPLRPPSFPPVTSQPIASPGAGDTAETAQGPAQETAGDRMNRLEREIADLRIEFSRVPEVEARVGRLEQEVAALRGSLDRPKAMPARPAKPKPAATPKTPETATQPDAPSDGPADTPKPRDPAKTAEASGSGQDKPKPRLLDRTKPEELFSVHLASYRSVEDAARGWRQLLTRYPDRLGALKGAIAQVEIEGRGLFYRLKAGPFAEFGEAETLCTVLRGDGITCSVMDFTGSPIGS